MHPLIDAAGRGDIAEIDRLLDEGVPPGIARGVWTPLQTAIARRHTPAALHLLSKGADPNQSNAGNQTPLWRACAVGLLEVVEALIEAKADVNAQDMDEGHTPLITAALRSHVDIAQALIAAGADMARMTQSGITAFEAAKRSHDARKDDKSRARAAAMIACLDAALTQALERTPLNKAEGEAAMRLAASTGRLDAVERLLAASVSPDVPDSWNTSPLGLAAVQGHGDVVAALMKAGADPYRRSMRRIYFERVPLFDPIGWAAARDRPSAILALAGGGIEIDRVDVQRRTPLMIAALHGSAGAVEALLSSGADPSLLNGRRKTALQLAKEAGHDAVVAVLEGT